MKTENRTNEELQVIFNNARATKVYYAIQGALEKQEGTNCQGVDSLNINEESLKITAEIIEEFREDIIEHLKLKDEVIKHILWLGENYDDFEHFAEEN